VCLRVCVSVCVCEWVVNAEQNDPKTGRKQEQAARFGVVLLILPIFCAVCSFLAPLANYLSSLLFFSFSFLLLLLLLLLLFLLHSHPNSCAVSSPAPPHSSSPLRLRFAYRACHCWLFISFCCFVFVVLFVLWVLLQREMTGSIQTAATLYMSPGSSGGWACRIAMLEMGVTVQVTDAFDRMICVFLRIFFLSSIAC
jgi:hypothetical protein